MVGTLPSLNRTNMSTLSESHSHSEGEGIRCVLVCVCVCVCVCPFTSLLIKWRFTRRVQKQMNAFRNVRMSVSFTSGVMMLVHDHLYQGFSDLIPLHLLRVFDERELEVRACDHTICE